MRVETPCVTRMRMKGDWDGIAMSTQYSFAKEMMWGAIAPIQNMDTHHALAPTSPCAIAQISAQQERSTTKLWIKN